MTRYISLITKSMTYVGLSSIYKASLYPWIICPLILRSHVERFSPGGR